MTAAGEPLVAAVDLGTNSALLLVARPAGGVLEEVLGLARTPRLGLGLSDDGRIRGERARHAERVMREFRAEMDALGVARHRRAAVGTAIFRRAANAAEVRAGLSRALGTAIRVLSEEEEARLGWEAVVGAGAGPETVVLDVGGGSTEAVAEAGRLRRSVPVGAVVLTERFLGLDGRAARESGGWPALERAARAALRGLPDGAARGSEVVALGGTATNLACLALGLEAFDLRRAEGVRVAGPAADAALERLLAESPAARRALPIEPDRAEVLPAGILCLASGLERLGGSALRVSCRGLRWAVASALARP